ncbi:unnamed protein product [Echinostoma caproni]|uniref:Ras-GAP domain-containing protein n=1 Tax=Echinostoma caproni TaxID=27848 RepID=A0A183AYJ1_9TREM|nr:unnamed protein product [Echinostoma caproni]
MQHISRLDFVHPSRQKMEISRRTVPRYRRTASIDSSLHGYRESRVPSDKCDSSQSRLNELSGSVCKLHRMPSTEEAQFHSALQHHSRVGNKPIPSTSLLLIENQHAPKLGSQHTQDSGYLSIDPSDCRSISSRGLNYSMSRQISQPFDELEESRIKMMELTEAQALESRKSTSVTTSLMGISATHDAQRASATARPISLQNNPGLVQSSLNHMSFSPPSAKKPRAQLDVNEPTQMRKRKYLHPKRQLPWTRSKSGPSIQRKKLHPFDELLPTPAIWTSYREGNVFQSRRSYHSRASEGPEVTKHQSTKSIQPDSNPYDYSSIALVSAPSTKVTHNPIHSPLPAETDQYDWPLYSSTASMKTGSAEDYLDAVPLMKSIGRRISWPPRRFIYRAPSSYKTTSRRNSEHSNSSATIIASRSSPIPSTTVYRLSVPPSQSKQEEQPTNNTESDIWSSVIAWGQAFPHKAVRFCMKMIHRSLPLVRNMTVSYDFGRFSIIIPNDIKKYLERKINM